MAKAPLFIKYGLLLRDVLIGTWADTVSEWKGDFVASINMADTAGMVKALKDLPGLGDTFVKAVGSPLNAVLSTTGKRANKYWQGELSKKADFSIEDLEGLAESQILSFLAQHPERIIHSEIMRQIELITSNPNARSIDVIQITERLEKIIDSVDYFDGFSEVHIARLWNAKGIGIAEDQGMGRCQIVEMMDKRTCAVCQVAHGQELEVPAMMAKIQAGMEISDPDDYNKFWHFPRFNEVQLWTNEDWTREGNMPPFHNRCRGTVRFLY